MKDPRNLVLASITAGQEHEKCSTDSWSPHLSRTEYYFVPQYAVDTINLIV